MCPPLAAVAALILYWIELTKARLTLYRADGRRRVYRRRGERFADACVVERDRFGGGSVMVWGGIAHGIKSQLIIVAGNMTAVRYRDEILRPVAVPLVQQRNLFLQQDNARPHVARVCQDFPLAAVAALILLWIELTKALTVRIGMLFHSSINAFLSCARVAGGFRRFLTLLSSSSHMCSI